MQDDNLPFVPMGPFRIVSAPGGLLGNEYNTLDLALGDAREVGQGCVAIVAIAQGRETVETVLEGAALQKALRKPAQKFENFPR